MLKTKTIISHFMKEEIFKIPLIFYCKLTYHYLTFIHKRE